MGSGAGVVAESRISPARAGWTGLLTGRADQAGFADGPRTGTPKAPGRWTDARRATGKCSPALQDRSASDGSPDAALRHCRQSNHGRGTDMSHTGGPDPDGRGRRGVISRRGASRSVRCTGPGTKRSRTAALVRHAAAGFLMGWVGFAALLALPLQAQAQTAYVSNTGQDGSQGFSVSPSISQAQGFTTGAQSGGYTLGRVGLKFAAGSSTAAGLGVAIYSAAAGGGPDAAVYTLTNPSSLASNSTEQLFTAPANATLSAGTTYYVVVTTSLSPYSVVITSETDEDSGASAGWSIEDTRYFRNTSVNNKAGVFIGWRSAEWRVY